MDLSQMLGKKTRRNVDPVDLVVEKLIEIARYDEEPKKDDVTLIKDPPKVGGAKRVSVNALHDPTFMKKKVEEAQPAPPPAAPEQTVPQEPAQLPVEGEQAIPQEVAVQPENGAQNANA